MLIQCDKVYDSAVNHNDSFTGVVQLEGLCCAQHGEEGYSMGIRKFRKENDFDWRNVTVQLCKTYRLQHSKYIYMYVNRTIL